MPADRQRHQFSLMDLFYLVGFCAFGLALVLLLLGSIEPQGRGTKRAWCVNNQGQVAKAHLYSATRDGYFVGYQQQIADRRVPWTVALLREMGRGDLADQWQNPITPASVLKESPRIDLLICPSDPPAQISEPALSYVLNAGISTPGYDNIANGIGTDRTNSNEAVSLAYVTQHDGTSTTLLLSENLQAERWDSLGKASTCFVWHPTTNLRPEHHINQGTKLPLSLSTARPSSNHSGGVVMSFCDGHTRFISEELDYRVYVQLTTPNDADSDMPAEWKNRQLLETDLQ